MPCCLSASARRQYVLLLLVLLGVVTAEDKNLCPEGLVQQQPIVFPCKGPEKHVTTRYLAPAGVTEAAFVIPNGTLNFDFAMTPDDAANNVDVYIYDLVSHEYVLRHDTGLVNDHKKSLVDNEACQSCPLTIVYSGSTASPERFALAGTTGRPWRVMVANRGIFPVSVTFKYHFDMIQGCSGPEVHGCGSSDPFWVQRTVVDWSAWAGAEYGSSDKAWRELAGSMQEQGVVPYYKWGYVWDAWPHAEDKGAPWQDVFHYISQGRAFVDRPAFDSALDLGRVDAAAKECIAEFRERYSSEGEAWHFLKDGGKEGQDKLIKDCSESTGVKLETLQDFMEHVDKSDGGLDKTEFQVYWDEVNVCPDGFYRNDLIVFHCHESEGKARYYMRARLTEIVTEIPAGVVNLRLGIVADQDVDLILWDPEANKWVVKWEGGIVNRKRLHGTYPAKNGTHVIFSGDETQPPYVEEYVQLQGKLPVPLSVQVNNFATQDTRAQVTYSWDRIEDCPKQAPVGCKPFDLQRGWEASTAYSEFLQQEYKHKEKAWDELCGPLVSNDTRQAESQGVAFYRWREVFRAWPDHHHANATWQEAFHVIDRDRNGIVDRAEFFELTALHEEWKMLGKFFGQLHRQFPDDHDAFVAVAKDNSEAVQPQAWRDAVVSFLAEGRLPGGFYICKPIPAMKPWVFSHTALMRISPGMATPSQTRFVDTAQSLGLVGGSFTGLARIWRGRDAGKPINATGYPEASKSYNHVFTTVSSEDPHRSLFMGVRNDSLALSFGPSTCQAEAGVPIEEWQSVAWVYNADTKEQKLNMNGKTVKTCKGVEPFQGFGDQLWLGKYDAMKSSWVGQLSNVYLFPSALSDDEVSTVFSASPAWAKGEEVVIKGEKDAQEVGTARELGLHGSSFSVMLRVLRGDKQEDSLKRVYTIIGAPQDNSFELVVWNGFLGISFDGRRCASEVRVPKGKWVDVAFVYDRDGWEHLIYQDGEFVKTCGDMPPYFGPEKRLWLGRSAPVAEGGILPWEGALRDVEVLPQALCQERLRARFAESLAAELAEAQPAPALPGSGAKIIGGGRRLQQVPLRWLAPPASADTAASPGQLAAAAAAAAIAKAKGKGKVATLAKEKEIRKAVLDHAEAIANDTFREIDRDSSGSLSQHELDTAIALALGWDLSARTASAAAASGAGTTKADALAASAASGGGSAEGPGHGAAAGGGTLAPPTVVPGVALPGTVMPGAPAVAGPTGLPGLALPGTIMPGAPAAAGPTALPGLPPVPAGSTTGHPGLPAVGGPAKPVTVATGTTLQPGLPAVGGAAKPVTVAGGTTLQPGQPAAGGAGQPASGGGTTLHPGPSAMVGIPVHPSARPGSPTLQPGPASGVGVPVHPSAAPGTTAPQPGPTAEVGVPAHPSSAPGGTVLQPGPTAGVGVPVHPSLAPGGTAAPQPGSSSSSTTTTSSTAAPGPATLVPPLLPGVQAPMLPAPPTLTPGLFPGIAPAITPLPLPVLQTPAPLGPAPGLITTPSSSSSQTATSSSSSPSSSSSTVTSTSAAAAHLSTSAASATATSATTTSDTATTTTLTTETRTTRTTTVVTTPKPVPQQSLLPATLAPNAQTQPPLITVAPTTLPPTSSTVDPVAHALWRGMAMYEEPDRSWQLRRPSSQRTLPAVTAAFAACLAAFMAAWLVVRARRQALPVYVSRTAIRATVDREAYALLPIPQAEALLA